MAAQQSFDVSTGVDLQEVDNAVNQARKEIATRYDFKGTRCEIEFDRGAGILRLEGDDEYRVKAMLDVLQSKLVRRGVPLRNVDAGKIEEAAGGRARQELKLVQAISADTAKQIAKDIRGGDFKKVQVAIQGDQLRVSSPSRDELQAVIAFLKAQDYGLELRFGNYR